MIEAVLKSIYFTALYNLNLKFQISNSYAILILCQTMQHEINVDSKLDILKVYYVVS